MRGFSWGELSSVNVFSVSYSKDVNCFSRYIKDDSVISYAPSVISSF